MVVNNHDDNTDNNKKNNPCNIYNGILGGSSQGPRKNYERDPTASAQMTLAYPSVTIPMIWEGIAALSS